MPCDTITTSGIKFGPNMDPALLIEGLKELGIFYSQQGDQIAFSWGTFNTKTQQASLRTYSGSKSIEEMTAEIKQAYARATVRYTARKNGWQLKETGKNQFEVIKRSY